MSIAEKYGITVAILIGIAILAVPFFLCLLFYRWYEKSVVKALDKILSSVEIPEELSEDHVEICYHTYHGVLAWVTQTEHKYVLDADNARLLLKKLRNFNLIWGCLAYGFVIIPILAIGNYWDQLNKINKQIRLRMENF